MNEWFRSACQESAEPLVVGQSVEIRRGRMRGLSGILVRLGRHDNCLVELDGTQAGILLSIASTSVWQRPTTLAAKAARSGKESTVTPRPERLSQ